MCSPVERENYLAIQKAVLEPAPKTIRFRYRGKGGNDSERHVEPYEVKGGENPQLVAWDIDKEATRRFILGQMRDITQTGESFKARFPIKIML